jgi:hypothetical protein
LSSKRLKKYFEPDKLTKKKVNLYQYNTVSMKYIRKPIIIIPAILLLLLGGIFAVFKYESLGTILLILSIGLMTISFIEALISKKWLKGVLYFIFYTLILSFSYVFFWIVVIYIGVNTPTKATTEFYNDRLNSHLESNKHFQLNTLCKQDEFYESFTGDLNTTCIFKLSNKEYDDLISEIENNKNFEKKNFKDIDTQIDLNKLECSKEITFQKKGYQSVNNSGMYARIIISTNNKYCLFNLVYY